MNKHFEESEWIDYARGILPPDRHAAIEMHIAQNCEQCSAQSFLWRAVVKRCAREAEYQPPADAVRWAKAAFSLARVPVGNSWRMRWAQLIADSSMIPAMAGYRSATLQQRQLAYRSDDLSIELSVGAGRDGGVAITGQVTSDGPLDELGSVRVMLVHDSAVTQEATASEFGEFAVDGRAGLTYWLVVDVPGRDPVALPIP